MSAALALKAARLAGVEVRLDGDTLSLRGTAEPPAAVLDALRRHKAEVVVMLRPGQDGWSAEDWQLYFEERAAVAEFDGGLSRIQAEAQAFECCVVKWLDRNPAPSMPGICAWCGRADAAVVPFGTEPGTHIWLHTECWRMWHAKRRTEAAASLKSMGITGSIDAHESSTRG